MAKMTLEKLAAGVDKKFDNLAAMVKRGFDGVDKRFAIIDKRLDVIEKRLDIIEKRLDILEQEIEAIKPRFTEAAWKFELVEIDRRVKRLEAKIMGRR